MTTKSVYGICAVEETVFEKEGPSISIYTWFKHQCNCQRQKGKIMVI